MNPVYARSLGVLIAALAIGIAIAYAFQAQEAPVGERLRYRAPSDGEQYVDDADVLREGVVLREGRTYVPAYSHAYAGSGTPVLFAVTLSIRNVDPTRALLVRRVEYHATAGEHVRSFLDRPRALPPLGTAEYFVEESDEAGGSGANFVVEWSMEPSGHPPRIEAVMLGSSGTSGFSFVTTGIDVSDAPSADAPAPGAPP